MTIGRSAVVLLAFAVGCLAVGAISVQSRALLTVKCVSTSPSQCKAVIPVAGGLSEQPLTVTFPAKGYYLSEASGTTSPKASYVLGPPGNGPEDYPPDGLEYVSKISADPSNTAGAEAILIFTLPATATTPTKPTVAKGSFYGTCGKDASGVKPCQVSFTLAAGGHRIKNLRFEPPACLVNNNTSSTLPVQPDGSFNITISYNGGSPKFTIAGKILSPTSAKVTLTATCNGKTTRRTMKLTKH